MQKFPPTTHSVPEAFLAKFGNYITAILSGFDRIRFRGVLRLLFKAREMDYYLARCGVLIKDFKAFAEELTGRVKAAAYQRASAAGRPVQYIRDSQLSKEEHALEIERHNCVPHFRGAVKRFRVVGGTGIVDEDIKGAKIGDDLVGTDQLLEELAAQRLPNEHLPRTLALAKAEPIER